MQRIVSNHISLFRTSPIYINITPVTLFILFRNEACNTRKNNEKIKGTQGSQKNNPYITCSLRVGHNNYKYPYNA